MEETTMMGRKKFNMKAHHNLCLDDLVSPGDLYRKIDGAVDFGFIYDLGKECYSHTGQPSLDPVVFFKIELVGFLEGIHEDRALERRIKDSLAIRWWDTTWMKPCLCIRRFQEAAKTGFQK
jgi:transposase